jgi:hypothetical protein
MSTKPGPVVKEFSEDTVEKKVYNLVDSLQEYIPIPNDRYRLGFGLYKYVLGDGDAPEVLVNSTKIRIEGIDKKELAEKLTEGISNIN